MSTQPDSLAQLDAPPPAPEWLPLRLRAWEAAHIITPEQGAAIRELEHTYAEPAESAFRYQRIIAIISAFGGILLAAGLILLVGSNWADIPRLAKVGLAIGAVVGLEALGYGLRYHTEYRRIGATFLFVGAAAYGAAIMLVAQAYQYPLDDPNLLLLWFAPVLPLAYLVRSPMIAALGIAVGYGALGYRTAETGSMRSPPAPASSAGRCSTSRSAPPWRPSGTSTTASVTVSNRWDDRIGGSAR